MNIDNIPDSNYIHIERWMYKLGLNLTEIALYACIHGFCRDGISTFCGSNEYLQAWSGAGRSTVFAALKKMTEKKLIVKKYDTCKGKPYPVYYTVRSRQMYQEMARRNTEARRLAKAEGRDAGGRQQDCYVVRPNSGRESERSGDAVQKTERCSPKTGRNNIALKNFGKAAEGINAKPSAFPSGFVSARITEYLGCDPYSEQFHDAVGGVLLKNGFDERLAGDYIRFAAEKARSKNPGSLPALFRKLVVADDVVSDFIMKAHADRDAERERTVICPCCGKSNARNAVYCSACEFDFVDKDNQHKVERARQIFLMDPEKRKLMEDEIGRLFQSFDIKKFLDHAETRWREAEMERIYRKYGITPFDECGKEAV